MVVAVDRRDGLEVASNVVTEILDSYGALQYQARRALQAKSTALVLGCGEDPDSVTKYLYLHPVVWSISGLRAFKHGMLQVALPPAGDPDPMRSLTRAIDRRLMEWLWGATSELKVKDRELVLQFAEEMPTLEEQLYGSRLKAVG